MRDSHAAFHGLIRPIDHPIWNQIYPPNGWNDRCNVVQTDKAVTPGDDPGIDLPDIFRNNIAKSGVIFSKDDHPYYKMPTKGIAKAFRNSLEKAKAKAPYFIAYKSKKSKRVLSSPFADKSGYKRDLDVAKLIADNGHEIKIQPIVMIKDRKNPEFEIDGIIGDRKAIKSLNGIDNGLKALKKQGGQTIVFDLDQNAKFWEDISSEALASMLIRNSVKRDWLKSYHLVWNSKHLQINKTTFANYDEILKAINQMRATK